MEKIGGGGGGGGGGRKNPKQRSDKAKTKRPVKVVYISNPMKVKATPAEFRPLVQELTGQDSAVPDQSPFTEADGGCDVPSRPVSTTFGRAAAPPGSVYAAGNPDVDLRKGP